MDALTDRHAEVITRFVGYVTGGIMREERALKSDELLLETLYARAQQPPGLPKRARTAGGVLLEPGDFQQTPWRFFMKFGVANMQTAMLKAWREFEQDANARYLKGKMDEVLESDRWWEAYGDYVRAVLMHLQGSAPLTHPTTTQMAARRYESMIDLNQRRARLVQLGLRNTQMGGGGGGRSLF